jgi:zinc transporter, ZIP family
VLVVLAGVATVDRERPRLWHFVGLAALAGLPAMLGVRAGGFVFNKLAAALLLAIGIGAIAQVVYEVWRLLARQSTQDDVLLVSWTTVARITADVGIMAEADS